MKILEFDCLPSTNDFLKTRINDGDAIVVAKSQTAGRGTKGRSFHSGMGGLYLSKLITYKDFAAARVFEIMLNTSVAVCKTLESFDVTPKIKWPNDIYVNGKKICGILIENTFSGNLIKNSIVGIGLNINNALPEELNEIATTMSVACGKNLDINEVKNRLIDFLQEEFSVAEYKKYIFFFHREITLTEGENAYKVTALDVDEKGRLIVEDNGSIRAVAAGEVSLRF